MKKKIKPMLESKLSGRKTVMSIDIPKNKSQKVYNAAMLSFKDFKHLEYQCSREELKIFKQLVIRAFVKESIFDFLEKEGSLIRDLK